MHGDFTRFTFAPTKHFSRVLKQQGRVDIDADWNELNHILDYLDRTTRLDLIGPVGVPVQSPGFEVTFNPLPVPHFEFSPGRIYVDGILVELDPPPPALTLPATPVLGQKDLVYLDVWERHITAIEDPTIREVALGGPDHCTRIKTEFQVRLILNIGAATCANPPLPGPSTGRLTAELVPAPPSDDPCLLTPSGGYRGLENRLYRVEIHQGGPLATATFKWSRDNGSIVFAITEFTPSPDRVRVSRLGRDQVLTFRHGDVVEILDDDNELNGTPGALVSILDIDEAHLELRLSAPVVAVLLTKHPKVRRWDQPSNPISNAITTGAGPFTLEDGIQVSFSGLTAATDFRTGDYWVFAARTATGEIEGFTNAPPKGIIHHYAALATVLWQPPLPPVIEICPPKFPIPTLPTPPVVEKPCCCCTVTVGAEGDFPTIDAALAGAPAGDFVIICVLPGVYPLSAPVNIGRDNVIIRGCKELTTVNALPGQAAFIVGPQSTVSIESLSIRGGGDWSILSQARDFRVRDNLISSGGIWIVQGSASVEIRDNAITRCGSSPGVALNGLPPELGFVAFNTLESVRIEANLIEECFDSGIACHPATLDGVFIGEVSGLEIVENLIQRTGLGGPRSPFLDPSPSALPASGGIFLFQARGIEIRSNTIRNCGTLDVSACGIILIECAATVVHENRIFSNGARLEGFNAFQAGIYAERIEDATPDEIRSGFSSLDLQDNVISTPAGPSLYIISHGSMSITSNRLHSARERLSLPLPASDGFGIGLLAVTLAGTEGFSPDARFLFEDNQVFSDVTEGFPNVDSSRCLLYSGGDLAINDNQFLAGPGRQLRIHVRVALLLFSPDTFQGKTLRVADNRFENGADEMSLAAFPKSAIVTGNHFGSGIILPASTILPNVIVEHNVFNI